MNPDNSSPCPKKQRGRPRKTVNPNLNPAENPKPEDIKTLTEICIQTLQTALQQTQRLAQERYRQKLSNHRICSVNRELKELLKVLTRYDRT